MPLNNHEALSHYQDTIKNKVNSERIFRYVDSNLKQKLNRIFGNKPISVWGSRNSPANRAKFERMSPGDDILIVEGDNIKLLGICAAKTINPDMSQELWKNLKGVSTEGWDLIYFIANPMEIDVPFAEFKKLFKYEQNWSLRGFTSISKEKQEEFYSKYDDLYSILLRIKNSEKIEEKKVDEYKEDFNNYKAELKQEDVTGILENNVLSEHTTIQWKLIRLGLKAGAKVWIPKSDQERINKNYAFNDFEEEFTTGIDIPIKYVNNIDVVWKEGFRIDAAFEVENSTQIFSGLLRFSDLKIIAPNSNYPLFIVAPMEKRNRLIEQIRRPTFKELEFEKKVRYLPYETINEIDKFFENSTSGLNVELLVGRSEEIS